MKHHKKEGRPTTTHRHAPSVSTTGHYSTLRRLERTIRRLARSRGLRGDPLAHAPAVADDLAGQMAALRLWLALPCDLRRLAESWPMAAAAAYGGQTRWRAIP
jgi:hypothetical protein